jgi:hypothetical protein
LRAEDVLAIDVLSGLRAANAAGFQVLKNKGRRRIAAGWGRLIKASQLSVNGRKVARQATFLARAAS